MSRRYRVLERSVRLTIALFQRASGVAEMENPTLQREKAARRATPLHSTPQVRSQSFRATKY